MNENETPYASPEEPEQPQKRFLERAQKVWKNIRDFLVGPTSNEPLPSPEDHILIGDITEQLLRNVHAYEIDKYVTSALYARRDEHKYIPHDVMARYKFRLLVEGYKRIFSAFSRLNWEPLRRERIQSTMELVINFEKNLATLPVESSLYEMMNSEKILPIDNHFRTLLRELTDQLNPEVEQELQMMSEAEKKPQTVNDLKAELLYQKIVDRLNAIDEDEKLKRAARLDVDYQSEESDFNEDDRDNTSRSDRSS